MFESEKTREFVLHIHKQGFVTKKAQTFYGSMGYYMSIWNLRDSQIIKEDGFDTDNQKIWRLTEKGMTLAKLFLKLKGVNDEIDKLVRREIL